MIIIGYVLLFQIMYLAFSISMFYNRTNLGHVDEVEVFQFIILISEKNSESTNSYMILRLLDKYVHTYTYSENIFNANRRMKLKSD